MDIESFQEKHAVHADELLVFLNKLDHTVPAGLSEIVETLDEEVWNEIDCTQCANCCKTMTPTYSKEDIQRIAKHLSMRPQDFVKKYLEIEDDSKDTVNKVLPCEFLVENRCSIYEVRPKDCAGYPYHQNRPFDEYNLTYIQNLGRCPATFRLIEKLEEKVRNEYEWE